MKSFNGWKIYNTHNENLISCITGFLGTLKTPDGWIHMHSSSNSKVWRFDCGNKSYVLKLFLSRSIFEGIKAIFKGSRAERAWKNSLSLIEKKFETPVPECYGRQSYIKLSFKCFIVTEYIHDAVGIYTHFRDNFSKPVSHLQFLHKKLLAGQFGTFVGRLHAAGFYHGDMRLDNILLVKPFENNRQKFFLIDNERNLFFHEKTPLKFALRNLIQVNMIRLGIITMSDRMRFFSEYLREYPLPDKKKIFRTISVRTREKFKRKDAADKT